MANYHNRYINEFKQLNTCRKGKYHIVTFGCQMNENDSEKISGILSEMGYSESDDIAVSDIIVFNTCCVRKTAENKIYGRIGALKGLKKERPSIVIAVGGCMTQQDGAAEYIRKKYHQVDIVFGTNDMQKLPEMIYNKVFNRIKSVLPPSSTTDVLEHIPLKRHDSIKAYVTIAQGCSNHCSYCVVPSVRGEERSRKKDDVIEEINRLVDGGAREIMLLGQNVNSYGVDLYGYTAFGELLYEIDRIKDLERIRFMTSHPKDLTGSLIDAMKNCKKVCEHLHLPLQAGSDRILSLMNRKYATSDYMDLVENIRGMIPGISITTDIIIGFPGETEEDFLDTLEMIRRIRFDTAYTFLYSERKGTAAALLPEKVPAEVIRHRFDRLTELQNKISKEINELLKDTEVEILAEGFSKNTHDKYTGRTRTNKIVNFNSICDLSGKLVPVRIKKVGTWSLDGICTLDNH